jgi:hypothetical protein
MQSWRQRKRKEFRAERRNCSGKISIQINGSNSCWISLLLRKTKRGQWYEMFFYDSHHHMSTTSVDFYLKFGSIVAAPGIVVNYRIFLTGQITVIFVRSSFGSHLLGMESFICDFNKSLFVCHEIGYKIQLRIPLFFILCLTLISSATLSFHGFSK